MRLPSYREAAAFADFTLDLERAVRKARDNGANMKRAAIIAREMADDLEQEAAQERRK